MSGSFESVKREAVQLERQLEDKISRFQQVRTEKHVRTIELQLIGFGLIFTLSQS